MYTYFIESQQLKKQTDKQYIYIQDVSKKRGLRVYRLVCNLIFKIETNFKI